ncbi:MAG: VWA domain-containing protein [Sphaerochaetaceae bacterium]|nr:VWA domain-containing protein [Sphaerochaetaceae bacterium]
MMFNLDEKGLIEESKKQCEAFIKKEQRSLVTFTGDSSLRYIPDPKLQKFVLSASEGILYLPLVKFLDQNLDENQIMWHIYYELALYCDWKSHTKLYINRANFWQKEIDYMTSYLLNRIKREGLEKDALYQPKIILKYVRKEIINLMYLLDKYTSFLRVLQLCPIYRDQENIEKIILYIKKKGKTIDSIYEMPKHLAFANSFYIMELYKNNSEIENKIKTLFNENIFKQSVFDFTRLQIIMQINKGEGISERDPFLRTFVFPIFKKFWQKEIDKMDFLKSKGEKNNQSKNSENPFNETEDVETQESIGSTQEEIENVLEEILDQKNQIDLSLKNATQNKIDLVQYGITDKDQQLFQYYANKMKSEREQMNQFWQKLIGNATKEKTVKQNNQIKGKLDVDSFINYYSDFIEAEGKGNYKNLLIFNRYLLKPISGILPEKIEISFLIDNSGSMDSLKIDSTRKTLAVTLLSIDDLNRYLKRNAIKLNQKIEVLTETWFFGSTHYNVKEFHNMNSSKKEKSDIIRSIVTIDGTDGATDDGSCLKEINEKITINQQKEIKRGKQIKIIFEITDGASSFPGRTKKIVQELLSKNVFIFSFQIGKIIRANEQIFNYVWNEGYNESHGVVIGEKVEKLPQELLKAVGENITSIFIN